MGGYAVDPDQLLGVDELLGECSSQARSALDGLQASAQALLAARWQGGAAVEFQQGWDEWHAGARDLLAALDEMAQAIGASGRAYAATDADVQAAVSRTSA
jgi:WXG100 family type VII secretion target